MSAQFAKPEISIGSGSNRAGEAVLRFVEYIRDWPRRRAVLNELNMLSDRELADIGLSRAQVPYVFERR
ncbi:MAG: DUF1127 domain-containing protein [Acidisphaera sp.]|nr:DUF1127 domain-containing protein [Acidisphaera sp.]